MLSDKDTKQLISNLQPFMCLWGLNMWIDFEEENCPQLQAHVENKTFKMSWFRQIKAI